MKGRNVTGYTFFVWMHIQYFYQDGPNIQFTLLILKKIKYDSLLFIHDGKCLQL
jgi:hypothetical protein